MKYSKEKLEYLRKYTSLSLIERSKLNKLYKHNATMEELEQVEYIYRFAHYEKLWNKSWSKLNWGGKEDQSLREFANDSLEEAILLEKNNPYKR